MIRNKTKKKEKYGYKKRKGPRIIEVGDYMNFYYYRNLSNCKLRTLDSIGKCLRKREDETVQAIKDVVGGKAFFVNLIRQREIDVLDKHFDRIFLNKVPIGYTSSESGGYQFHALYVSPNCSGAYERRLKKHIKSKSD